MACFTPYQQQVYKHITALEFDSASVALAADTTINAPHLLLQNYLMAIKLLVTDNVSEYEKIKTMEENHLQVVQNLPDEPYMRAWVSAEIMLQWAFVKAKYSHEFKAVKSGLEAYRLLKSLEETYPTHLLHKKSLGWINVLVSQIPEKYQRLAKWMGIYAQLEQGMEQLKAATTAPNCLAGESVVILEWLSESLSDTVRALSHTFLQLRQNEPWNEMAKLVELLYYKNHKNTPAMMALLPHMKVRKQSYLVFTQANCYLYSLELEQAANYFKKFIYGYGYPFHKHEACYKLMQIYHLQSQPDSIEKFRKILLKLPDPEYSYDKESLKNGENNRYTHPIITQARWCIDGGFYAKAIHILDSCATGQLPPNEKILHHYFKARAYHALNDTLNAIRYYEITVNEPTLKNEYYQPNALLQLGNLHFHRQPDKAKYYFKACLKYKKYPYENDITAQAKEKLKKLQP